MATPGAFARRSSAVLGEIRGLDPARAVEAVDERYRELLASLLGRDWLALGAHVRSTDGTYPPGFAWRAGYALHHLGHLADATAMVEYAESSGSGDVDRSRLASVGAAVAWSRGDLERARESTETALKHARAAGDPGAEAMAWVASALLAASDGDRDRNLQCYERAVDLAERAGDDMTVERVCNNLGSRSLEEGRNSEALDHLIRGMLVNERTGHLSGLAVLRHNTAEALLGLGRIDEALVECDAARDLWTALEAPSVSVSWHLRGDIQIARGNATQAAAAHALAAELAEQEGDSQTRAMALAGRAVALVAADPQRAAAIAESALAVEAPIGQAIPVLLVGWVRLACGDRSGAAALADRGAELASRHRDLPRLADALDLRAVASDGATAQADAWLREAGAIWTDLDNPVRRLVHEHVAAVRARDRLTATVTRDELRSWGVHDDAWRIAGPLEPVPTTAWPSRKARDVLKVLACRGERGISRERLGALIWPDADSVGNRLSVALSHVRGVLDPGRGHPSDHFVRADRDVVRLDLDHVEVDCVEFVTAARSALAAARAGSPRAVPLLQGAAAMHGGELCEADPHAEWTQPERDRIEALGIDVLRALAGALAAGDEPADALPWYARILAGDPYDERTYGDVIRLLCRLGRYGQARHQYRTYDLRMKEIGVPSTPWGTFVVT